jgi:hypothetical protein
MSITTGSTLGGLGRRSIDSSGSEGGDGHGKSEQASKTLPIPIPDGYPMDRYISAQTIHKFTFINNKFDLKT